MAKIRDTLGDFRWCGEFEELRIVGITKKCATISDYECFKHAHVSQTNRCNSVDVSIYTQSANKQYALSTISRCSTWLCCKFTKSIEYFFSVCGFCLFFLCDVCHSICAILLSYELNREHIGYRSRNENICGTSVYEVSSRILHITFFTLFHQPFESMFFLTDSIFLCLLLL